MAGCETKRSVVESFVGRRVSWLQDGLLMQKSTAARAQLARLRRSVSMRPGNSPDTWDVEFAQLPEQLSGKGSTEATAGEWAVHLALSLYATHQQSQDQSMFCRTNASSREFHGIGDAVRQLVAVGQRDGRGEQLSQGEMPRRFKALVTAESIEELAHYARQLVTQLRGERIPLDYARLAGQLYDFQNPYYRSRVRLEWAREFSRQVQEAENQ